jgi:hypothetical protein
VVSVERLADTGEDESEDLAPGEAGETDGPDTDDTPEA